MKGASFLNKYGYPAGLALLALSVFTYVFDPKININGDNCYYYIFASSLAAGNGFTDMLGNASALFPPGYPLLMAPLRLLTGSVVAQKILNLLFLFGASLLFFRILAAEGAKRSIAFIVAAALLVTPHLLEFATMMMSEASCVFFIALSLWAFLHVKQGGEGAFWRSPWLWLFLVFTVYTFYIRTQAVVFVAAFLVAFLVTRRFRLFFALSGAFAVAVAPWVLRNLFLGLEQSRYVHQVDFSKVYYILHMLVVQAIPESIIPFFRVRYNAMPSLLLYVIAFSMLAFTIYGFCRFKRLRLPLIFFFLGNLLLVSIMNTPSYYRYMIIVMPVITAGFVVGLWSVLDLLCRRSFKKTFSPAFMLLLFVPIFFFMNDKSKHTVWGLHRSAGADYPAAIQTYLSIGREAASLGKNSVVASRKPELLYVHSGVRGVRYKEGRTNVQIVSDFLADDVDYIILENFGSRYALDVLYPCLKEHKAFFRPLKYTSHPTTVLFRFEKEAARKWLLSLGSE